MENTPTEVSVPISSASPNCWFPSFSSVRNPRFKRSKVWSNFSFLLVLRSLWLKAIVWTGHFRVFPTNGELRMELHIPETKRPWTYNKQVQLPLSSQIMPDFISQWERSFNSAWWWVCSRLGTKRPKAFSLFSHGAFTFFFENHSTSWVCGTYGITAP